jgi:hypothetical protein
MYLYHSGKSQNLLEWYKFADPGVTQVHFTCMKTGFLCLSLFLQAKVENKQYWWNHMEFRIFSLKSISAVIREISEVNYYWKYGNYDVETDSIEGKTKINIKYNKFNKFQSDSKFVIFVWKFCDNSVEIRTFC